MVEPTGYTALDLIGFTDRGNYNPVTNYVKNDLVHYGGSIWRILIDDTMGQTPQEGLYYTVFVKEPTNMVERIMAPLEQNPATQAWTVGRQIINNDYLYEVIAPIAIGDNLVAYEDDPTNANIKLAPPIETQVLAIKNEADKTEDMIAPAESNPAAASHSVGDQIIFDNILYNVTSPIAANDALVAYPTTGYNIKPAASVSSQIQALSNQNTVFSAEITDMNNVLGAKNLLKNDIVQQNLDGTLLITKKPDESITISGTASQTRWLNISTAINLKDGVEYILSGFPTGWPTDNRLSYEEIVNGVAVAYNDYGSGVTFTPNPNRTSNKVYIRVQNGQSFTPAITIRPMIRPVSIEDDTYVPYAKGNRELTENVSSIHYQYYNYADGTTEIALPGDWKEMIVMTNLNKGNYMITAHFTNDMMASGFTNHSFGNYGTSYAVGQISKSKVKLTSAKFSDSDVTNNTRISIYLR